MEQVANSQFTGDFLPKMLVTIGGYTFILHKSHVINKSAYFRDRVQDKAGEESALCAFSLEEFPGGANTFKIIAKFWYDEEYELTSSNVVPIICAAHHLHMMEDCASKNLIIKSEKFMAEKIFTNWKESVEALISCEDVLKQAEELEIVSKYVVSLAEKVMHHDSFFSDWWYEDICRLNLALFKRLIQVLGAMGHDALNISNAVVYYANEYDPGSDPCSSGNWSVEEGMLLEEIVGLLPTHNGVNTNKYLVSMLRAAIMLNANSICIESLEKRIGSQLDECTLQDLFVSDFWNGRKVTLNICCIRRIIEHFVEERLIIIETFCHYNKKKNAKKAIDLQFGKIMAIGKIIDDHLERVAIDSSLKLEEFLSVASVIPDGARPSHDALYYAISAYIEYRPWLCKQQNELLCGLLDVQKISRDACRHAILNFKHLPAEFIFEVFFSEIVHIGRWLDEDEKATRRYLPKCDSIADAGLTQREWQLF